MKNLELHYVCVLMDMSIVKFTYCEVVVIKSVEWFFNRRKTRERVYSFFLCMTMHNFIQRSPIWTNVFHWVGYTSKLVINKLKKVYTYLKCGKIGVIYCSITDFIAELCITIKRKLTTKELSKIIM